MCAWTTVYVALALRFNSSLASSFSTFFPVSVWFTRQITICILGTAHVRSIHAPNTQHIPTGKQFGNLCAHSSSEICIIHFIYWEFSSDFDKNQKKNTHKNLIGIFRLFFSISLSRLQNSLIYHRKIKVIQTNQRGLFCCWTKQKREFHQNVHKRD